MRRSRLNYESAFHYGMNRGINPGSGRLYYPGDAGVRFQRSHEKSTK